MYFFFFKHKTAYEMRISDWSSDVCSSDLLIVYARLANAERRIRIDASELAHSRRERAKLRSNLTRLQTRDPDTGLFNRSHFNQYQIGRASCRERECTYV